MPDSNLQFLRPPPPGRSAESIERQFLVEKSLADKLRVSNREERRAILASMYDELFTKVPEHSRLKRREDPEKTRQYNQSKLALLRRYLKPETVFLEFGSGDCQFAYEVAKTARESIGVEISDQRDAAVATPQNFRLVIYDGFDLDAVPSDSVDLAFSDQLIEHLHLEDSQAHFALIYRILRKGGTYVLRTPHFHTGPHDISKYFSDVAQGFHMKEWTFTELRETFLNRGFSNITALRGIQGKMAIPIPYLYLRIVEAATGNCPGKLRRLLGRMLLPPLVVAATK